MDAWVWPAYFGVFMGLGAFALFLVPILAVQYRLYGRITVLRLLGAVALSVYGAALIAYTLLPLPNPGELQCAAPAAPWWDGVQARPFTFVSDIVRETAGLSLLAAAKSTVVLQVVFNVVLFLPWGLIARRFLGWGILTATASGFAASLVIELTQATGIYGIYDCAYRLGDADDLIMNTAGAFLGALLAPAVLWFFPERRAFAAARTQPRPVTVWRRWLGQIIDLAAYTAVGMVLVVAARAIALYVLDTQVPLWLTMLLSTVVPGLLVFLLPALAPTGASIGQRAVWLGVSNTPPAWRRGFMEDDDGTSAPSSYPATAPLGRRLLRALAVGGLYAALEAVAAVAESGPGIAADPLSGLLLVAAFLAVVFTPSRRGLSGWASGTYLVDVRGTEYHD